MREMMQKLAQMMPQAKDEDHLAEMASSVLGPPPQLPGFTGMAPPTGMMRMHPGRKSPFAKETPNSMVPPMPAQTRGEAATSDRTGSYILGGKS